MKIGRFLSLGLLDEVDANLYEVHEWERYQPIMLGATIAELRAEGLLPATGDGAELPAGTPVVVKEAVLPFHRFRTPEGHGVDSVLGPEMKSTGEVMGIDTSFDLAFAKAQLASGTAPPTSGRIYISTALKHLPRVIPSLKTLQGIGFEIVAEDRTVKLLWRNGIAANAPAEGDDPAGVARRIANREISLVISLPAGGIDRSIDRVVRTAASQHGVPYVTTVAGLLAMVGAICASSRTEFTISSLQDIHARIRRSLIARGHARSLARAAARDLPENAAAIGGYVDR